MTDNPYSSPRAPGMESEANEPYLPWGTCLIGCVVMFGLFVFVLAATLFYSEFGRG